MYTIRVVAAASALWAFAVAAVVFHVHNDAIVILLVGGASTASTWIIARFTAERLKNELMSHIDSDVHPLPPNRKQR